MLQLAMLYSQQPGVAGALRQPARQRRDRPPLQEPQRDKQKQKQQQGKQVQRQFSSLHGLFGQQETQQQHGMVVTPAGSGQAVLPEGALSDPTEALNPSSRRSRRGRPAGGSMQLEQLQQQPDPQLQQLMTQFQPFMQALQKIARQQQQQQQKQQQGSRRSQHRPPGQNVQQQEAAAADVEARLGSSPSSTGLPAQADVELQQQRGQHIRAPGRTSRLLELFGVQEQAAAAAEGAAGAGGVGTSASGLSAIRTSREAADALSAQPSQAKQAAQRLAQMIMQQQQARKQQQQQQSATKQPPAGANSAAVEQAPDTAAAAAADADGSTADAEQPGQVLTSAVPQAGTTRIYLPAPPLAQASSAADRQPLRLLSIRQQEQLRKEARAEAIRKMRERTVRDYQACLDQLLMWQPAGTALHIPGAPRHLPVAVQQAWTSSSSSSSSLPHADAPADSTAAAAAAAPSKPPWVAGPAEQRTLQQISAAVQQQLGQPLPTRAAAGERGQLLSCLAAAAVSERLQRWVACCGRAYAQQLIMREPSLLAHEPQALLQTLEALNSQLQLPTEDCVAFALKHVVLVGLDAAEVQQRLQGLQGACGCGGEQAVKLAVAAPELLMLHPDNVQERLAALSKLLPEAAPKLPRVVLRSPFLLLRSPRAVARGIQGLSEALGLSCWAASRLVAGQPGILRNNFDTLRGRLARLQSLTAASWRWHRQLQALSPSALARCLTCADAALDRLQLLADVGAAGSARLPAVNFILTMPEAHFADMLAKEAARGLRLGAPRPSFADASLEAAPEQQQQVRRGGRSRPAAGSSSSSSSRVDGVNGAAAGGSALQATAAEALDSRSSRAGGEGRGSVEGVLDGDRAWRDGLAGVLQQTSQDLRRAVVGAGSAAAAAMAGRSARHK
ncbi:hypothetical protein COO60DRAFT_1640988 [Scenedesmus sp. NREL 46B-D3]|nr:hypothetical protein COO60DRAFT_1640988 [Scenedesmus sp. NREL 46B-D3]